MDEIIFKAIVYKEFEKGIKDLEKFSELICTNGH